MARRKSASIKAPTTLAEATGMAAEYAAAMTTVEGIKAHYDQIIADLQAERDKILEPYETGMKDLFTCLRAWWSVAGDDVTGGKRKTAKIAGLLLGLRTTTPSLKLPKGKNMDDILSFLDDRYEGDFLTTTTKLDKPSLIAALRGEDGPIKTDLEEFGFAQSQREEFFIDRDKPEAAAAEPKVEPADGQEVLQ